VQWNCSARAAQRKTPPLTGKATAGLPAPLASRPVIRGRFGNACRRSRVPQRRGSQKSACDPVQIRGERVEQRVKIFLDGAPAGRAVPTQSPVSRNQREQRIGRGRDGLILIGDPQGVRQAVPFLVGIVSVITPPCPVRCGCPRPVVLSAAGRAHQTDGNEMGFLGLRS
jgi:hypothetical protein